MEPKIFPLDAITPEIKNWTAKVSILNKTEPRTSSQPSSIRFQKLLLADNRCTAAVIIDSHPPRTVMAKGKENTLHEYAAVDELIFRNGELCIHKERIDVLQQQGDVFRKAQTNFSHDPESFTSIETLLTTEQPNRYDLLARGKVTRTNQNFIYPCCAKCHRLTSAAYGRSFECHSCHEIRNAIPRVKTHADVRK
ncbi:hypothetical protein OROHE_011098 [Orobanche hederae]